MLNPLFYDRMIPLIDDNFNKHIKPYFNSRPKVWRIAYNDWFALTDEQKKTILEFVEKCQIKSIQKQMQNLSGNIPVPKIGIFTYSPAKYFKYVNKEELYKLPEKEIKEKILEYHIKHKKRKYNSTTDGEKIRFTKDASKR